MICPRCLQPMRHADGSGFPTCLACGYEDYSFNPAPPRAVGRAFRATRIRYGGPEKRLRERVVSLRVTATPAGKIRELREATCPFCDQPMRELQPTYSDRRRGAVPFACDSNHRIRVRMGRRPDGEIVEVWQ